MEDNNGSLEIPETLSGPPIIDNSPPPQPQQKSSRRPNRKLFIIVIGISLLLVIVGLLITLLVKPKPPTSVSTHVVVNTQTLSTGTLQKIEQQQGASSGSVSEQLTISPTTLFKSDVTVQGETSFAKNVQIGSNLSVGDNTTIGGDLSVTGTISSGALSVSSLTLKSLHVSGDFNLSGHIVPSGNRPAVSPDVASSGGTVTIDGSDTSGTVSITTGSGNQNAGELAIITFATAFATNPRVQLTPANAASAGLQYYVSQSPKFFSIETSKVPDAGSNYVFNYFVTQ